MLLTLREITVGFGVPPILDRVSLTVEERERIAVVGRNGAGKSTLLNIAAGCLLEDSGEIIRAQGLRTGHLPQTVPAGLRGTVFEVVAAGLGPVGAAAAAVRRLSARRERTAEESRALEEAQAVIDRLGGWEVDRRIETITSRLLLEPAAEFAAGDLLQLAVIADEKARAEGACDRLYDAEFLQAAGHKPRLLRGKREHPHDVIEGRRGGMAVLVHSDGGHKQMGLGVEIPAFCFHEPPGADGFGRRLLP